MSAVLKREPKLDPNTFPDIYGMTVSGTCMEPEFAHGSVVVFDKTMPFGVGDVVGIWLKPKVEGGEPTMWLKRVVVGLMPGQKLPYVPHPKSEVHPILIVEQISPPKTYSVKCDGILAVHRCVGAPTADMRLTNGMGGA